MARDIERANGFVHDIDHLQALSSEPCNIRLLSDRALYILQNLATKEVGFFSRYGVIISQGRYIPVEPVGTQGQLVQDTQNQIREELQDLTIENALNNIAASISLLAQNQCCDKDGAGGAGEAETTPTSNQDDGQNSPDPTYWPTYPEYEQDKCNRATGVVNQIQEDVNNLVLVNWGGVLALPIGEALLLLVATLLTPIPGDELLGVLAVLSTLSVAVSQPLSVVVNAIVTVKQDLICDLYDAPDVQTAKADARATLQAEIDAQSSGIIQTAANLIGAMFWNNNSLNPLFDPAFTYDYPNADCSNCGGDGDLDWTFDTGTEMWSFTDISSNGGSAVGAWNAAQQGLEIEASYIDSPSSTGFGSWKSPAISFTPTTLPRVTVEHTGPNDSILVAMNVWLEFASSPDEFQQVLPTGPATEVLNFATNDEVTAVRWEVGRSNGPTGGPPATFDITATRIILDNQ